MTIAIDFDGTIASYDGFKGKGVFGAPIEGAVAALILFRSCGHTIIINTTRLEVDLIKDYLVEHLIPFDYVNYSPKNTEQDLHPAKQQADVYIDDRGVTFNGKWDKDFIDRILAFKPWWRK